MSTLPSTPVRERLVIYAGLLALVFGSAFLVGRIADLDTGESAPAHAPAEGHVHGAAPGATAGATPGATVSPGLVAERGVRLELAPAVAAPGAHELRLRIVDAAGRPVIPDDAAAGGEPVHVIVVRRDLSTYDHLHPSRAADGSWVAPLDVAAPGVYRVFADLVVSGVPLTLGADLTVPGELVPAPLPAPAATARAGPYDVVLAGSGTENRTLDLSVSKLGRPVALEPYLGAGGHLVVLREGDLAFVHAHPVDDAAAAAQGRLRFEVAYPSPGRYRLFLQLQVDGAVQTAAFTRDVSP